MIILDFLINNYLNILSSLIILNIFYLTKNKYCLILIIDILVNNIPYISIIILLLYFLNKLIFNKIINNNINKFIFSIIYYFIFISILFLINRYNFSFKYYLYMNIFSFIFNLLIYYIYIFYKE